MSRAAPTFRQSDVTRALKAAAAAGLPVRRYEIDKTGKIVVLIGLDEVPAPEPGQPNEWDGAA